MKKTFLLAGLLLFTSALTAQTMTLCQAFEKLGGATDDFSPFIGAKSEKNPFELASSIQVDQANKSVFRSFPGPNTFEASLGSFKEEYEAKAFVTKLQNQMKSCFPIMQFSDTYDKNIHQRESQIVLVSNTGMRVYEACFRISQIGGYDVSFVFPQAEKASNLSSGKVAYRDYQYITENADDSALGFSLKLIMLESLKGFEGIKGDMVLDPDLMFSRFEARVKLTGYENCYIEDRGLGIIFYETVLCKDVDEKTVSEVSQTFFPKLMSALGSDYAYSPSTNGMTVTFIRKADPAHRVGTLYIEKKLTGYTMTLSLDAYR